MNCQGSFGRVLPKGQLEDDKSPRDPWWAAAEAELL